MRSSSRIPTAIVASVALVAVMGSATALPGKGTVDKNDLAKNSVKGKHVKDDSLSGKDIVEATLGKVPSAGNADTAGRADTAARADTAGRADTANALVGHQTSGIKRVAATSGADRDAARGAAAEVTLFTVGPFTIYGKCFHDAGTDRVYAATFVKTTEAGSIFTADYGPLAGDGGRFLNPDTPEAEREAQRVVAGGDGAQAQLSGWNELGAMSPGGTAVEAHLQVAAKNGEIAGGNGIYGAGDVCLFAGEVDRLG